MSRKRILRNSDLKRYVESALDYNMNMPNVYDSMIYDDMFVEDNTRSIGRGRRKIKESNGYHNADKEEYHTKAKKR